MANWDRWIGPCVHGRDPWTRCEICKEWGELKAIAVRLSALSAENAALLGQLAEAKTAEREACIEDVRAALTTGLLTPGDVKQVMRAIRRRAEAANPPTSSEIPKWALKEEEALASHPDDCRCSKCSAHEERMRRAAADLGDADRYLEGLFSRASVPSRLLSPKWPGTPMEHFMLCGPACEHVVMCPECSNRFGVCPSHASDPNASVSWRGPLPPPTLTTQPGPQVDGWSDTEKKP